MTMTKEGFFNHLKSKNVILNEVQEKACVHYGKPLLLLSAPGTGKTTTTIAKIGYMTNVLNIPANEILAVTFSKASANDMSLRYQQFFPNGEPVHFSTIHSLAYQIVREEKLKYQLIETSGVKMNKNAIIRKAYFFLAGEKIKEQQLEQIATYISLVKNLCTTPEEFLKTSLAKTTDIPKYAKEIYKIYEEEKNKMSPIGIDFDDMLIMALDILLNNEVVASKYQEKYSFLLIDEAQDTSLIQHEIADVLVAKHENIYMVADDDQSIYSFRAADPENLLNFSSRYPSAEILKMEINYRSTKKIIEVANQFIKEGVVHRFDKTMTTPNEVGKSIVVKQHYVATDEINEVIKEIKNGKSYKDFAILYRNNETAIPFVFELARQDIPFYIRTVDTSFFNHFIVNDIRNYFRLMYTDKVKHLNLIEELSSRFKGYLKKSDFKWIKDNYKEDDDLWEALLSLPDIRDYQRTFFNLCKRILKKNKDKAPMESYRSILYTLDYYEALMSYATFLGMNDDKVDFILSILEKLINSSKDVVSFFKELDDIEKRIKNAANNAGKDAVNLTTFHSSKGLEYEKVFIVDAVSERLPSKQEMKSFKSGNKKALDEAYRLFYVAMTRAKKELTISYSGLPSLFVRKTKDYIENVDNKYAEKKEEMKNNKIEHNEPSLKKEELKLGKYLHKIYGEVTVQEINDKNIVILTDSNKIKTLSLDYCLTKRLLLPIENQEIKEDVLPF